MPPSGHTQRAFTLHQLRTFLVERVQQQAIDGRPVGDQSIDLRHLIVGELSPAFRRRPSGHAIEQNFHFRDAESDSLGELDDDETFENRAVVAAASVAAQRGVLWERRRSGEAGVSTVLTVQA